MGKASFTSKPVRTVEIPEPSTEPLDIPKPDELEEPVEPEPAPAILP